MSSRTTRLHASASNATCALVCLDFDLTVLRVHSFSEGVRAEDVRRGARDFVRDFVDVDVFRAFYGARDRCRTIRREDVVGWRARARGSGGD